MRITNRQFYDNYLAGYDGSTIYTLLSRILFLVKKKYVSLFFRLKPDQYTEEMHEMVTMMIALKKTGKLDRQPLTSLIRLVQEKHNIPSSLTLRVSNKIDEEMLPMIEQAPADMIQLEHTDASSLFIQQWDKIYKRWLESDLDKLLH